MLKTVQPPVEIVPQNETHKGDSVSFISESDFQCNKTEAPRRLKIKVRANKTPSRLRAAKADDPEVIVVSDVGKGKRPIEMEEKVDAEVDDPEIVEISKAKKRKKQDQVLKLFSYCDYIVLCLSFCSRIKKQTNLDLY